MTSPNRSEILFVYDAQDCNPNGNPIGDNRPRRDPTPDRASSPTSDSSATCETKLHDDGYDIYVKKVDGESRTRTTLIKDVLEDVSDAEDVEELEDLGTDFLQAATDVRYFGATLSFETSENEADEAFREGLNNALPNHYQGPVQFLPSKSLNEVEENEEYDSLTSVISTGEENRQGGFDLDDKRIKYGIFPFWGARRRQRCGVDPAHPGGCGATGYALLAGAEEPDDLARSSGKSLASTSAQSTNLRTTTSAVSTNSSTSVRTAPTLFAP